MRVDVVCTRSQYTKGQVIHPFIDFLIPSIVFKIIVRFAILVAYGSGRSGITCSSKLFTIPFGWFGKTSKARSKQEAIRSQKVTEMNNTNQSRNRTYHDTDARSRERRVHLPSSFVGVYQDLAWGLEIAQDGPRFAFHQTTHS